ncbi:DUF3025 domain-containing protein [Gallaecimonas kandeliae]|uniref:DUF3025 domain-containing protein n=1 Tax=Gallaecimonas kandeliae TaxID=3029055 RepID=UPI00264A494B|nr:DUF3025 domain-containing protein [Gallaecimonas kandeliae]WKE66962.1 DUF3025 domain-containing protein [Gallaecimonas kandeliae]
MTWQRHFLDEGLYGDLKALFPKLGDESGFPGLDTLTAWLPAGTATRSGQPVSFCSAPLDDYYEAQILATGRVPTRPDNWHDCFNALAWALYPRAKAAINAQHVADIEAHGLSPRTLRRDSLTLFDECGVLVVAASLEPLEALRQHHWQQAFVEGREQWGSATRPFVFGHAVYEQGLAPYLGLTAKMLPLLAPPAFFGWALKAQYAWLDERLCELLASDGLKDKSLLSPLPLLGVPGWWPQNSDPAFYANLDYFRPLRRPRPPLQP